MKRVTDERLKIELLKNIRIVFIFQTLGILAVLIYTEFQEERMRHSSRPFFLYLPGPALL